MNSLDTFAKFIPSSPTGNPTVSITTSPVLTDVEAKARRFTNCLTDSLYELSNEPSLGLYRIQVGHYSYSFLSQTSFKNCFLNYRSM
jgi:hypothetical protein